MTSEQQTAAEQFIAEGFTIVRIAAEHRGRYDVLLNNTVLPAEITGKMMYGAESRTDYPAVGDWVAAQVYDTEGSPAIIHHILPRTTTLSRKTSGRDSLEQIMAVNVDIVFIVQALDQTFNVRRLERFHVVAAQSGARPVILLSKADLLTPDELSAKLSEVGTIAATTTVIHYSAKTMTHLDSIRALIGAETTVCFIGPSGAGKSTLINRLIGRDHLVTQEVREEDAKGKHTTTHRELIALENGGSVIDTPGLREIGLWEGSDDMEETFGDIAEFGEGCRFTDCTHTSEPGCAVRHALEEGTLDQGRYESYMKLRKEAEFIASRTDIRKQLERKAREKQLGRAIKQVFKQRKKR